LSVDTRIAVGDQQRESVRVPGPLVDEIDVEPLDFGDGNRRRAEGKLGVYETATNCAGSPPIE
jgi:hypothetical protein